MPDEREEFTLEEFVSAFGLDRIALGGPIFDQEKLRWLNGKYLRRLSGPEWLDRLRHHLLADDYLLKVFALVRERIDTLEDFFDYAHFFFAGEVPYGADERARLAPGGRAPAEAARGLAELLEKHLDPLLDWNAGAIEAAVRAFADAAGWNAKDAFMALRVAATGRTATPPLFETLEVLGKETVRRRLRRAAEELRASPAECRVRS
jgi:glutamyl-tRNA synthetase